jgi:signal transduction histidine kinase
LRIFGANRILRSVFTKLLVVILTAGICINLLAIGIFFAYRQTAVAPFSRTIDHYVDYLINDLGSPPDLARAREIARRTSLAIHYESPRISWSTADAPVSIDFSRLHVWHESPGIRIGSHHGKHVIAVKRGKGRFIFEMQRRLFSDSDHQILIVIFFSLLALILGGAYFSIRWILRPVKFLNQGVQQVSGGNLRHRVPQKSADELGDLTAAFNSMTDRIRKMLHAKQQLLLDVSHELRSPITRMKIALEMMPAGSSKDNLQRDLGEIEKMVNEILETARMHQARMTLNLQRTDIIPLVDRIAAEYRDSPPGVDLQHLPDSYELTIDPQRFQTVMRNLLDNAVRYSENDSRPLEITLAHQASYCRIDVKDSGCGIPAEELPHVFEPFYRIDKSRSRQTGGYGLGLSICQTIMEAHKGRIEVESTVGQGTTFSVYFPEDS